MTTRKAIFLLFAAALLLFALPAFADELLLNPSFYSAADIAYDMPKYWTANYIELQEYLKSYRDFNCDHYSQEYEGTHHDQIVCVSVNNERTRDVIINLFFEGDYAGMTGLQEVVFTISTPQTKDIQDTFEHYWLNDAYPWHFNSDVFYQMPSLIFHTKDTVMRYDFPNYAVDGLDYMTVDMWDINYTRIGVG
ncbi:MAG: hypothetical protein IJI14_08165 [Anaerolineaceae bacterium]|nr:hypothetical protein [Anaerolineaceae bacterium]